jgi:hypothetical protein
MKLAIVTLALSACVTSPDDPELETTTQDLTASQIAMMNNIGREVGLGYAWTAATRTSPARLDETAMPVAGVQRDTVSTRLDGGFEHRFHEDPGSIDPCWFTEIGPAGLAPVVSVKSLRAGTGYGTATFVTAGTNYTIEGTASAADPSQPAFALQFVVRDASGNIVFDSSQH